MYTCQASPVMYINKLYTKHTSFFLSHHSAPWWTCPAPVFLFRKFSVCILLGGNGKCYIHKHVISVSETFTNVYLDHTKSSFQVVILWSHSCCSLKNQKQIPHGELLISIVRGVEGAIWNHVYKPMCSLQSIVEVVRPSYAANTASCRDFWQGRWLHCKAVSCAVFYGCRGWQLSNGCPHFPF